MPRIIRPLPRLASGPRPRRPHHPAVVGQFEFLARDMGFQPKRMIWKQRCSGTEEHEHACPRVASTGWKPVPRVPIHPTCDPRKMLVIIGALFIIGESREKRGCSERCRVGHPLDLRRGARPICLDLAQQQRLLPTRLTRSPASMRH